MATAALRVAVLVVAEAELAVESAAGRRHDLRLEPQPAPPRGTPRGEVAEWLNVPVSKTGVGQPTGGSNPPLSAIFPAGSFAGASWYPAAPAGTRPRQPVVPRASYFGPLRLRLCSACTACLAAVAISTSASRVRSIRYGNEVGSPSTPSEGIAKSRCGFG